MEPDSAVVRKATVDRSPRFPFIPLAKALERAQEFYDHEKRGKAPYAAAAQHWGYRQSSSSALQTFAALKNYGLLDGNRNGVHLTDLALRILLDKRPDSGERNALMRQAALNPSIAAEVNTTWPDGLPSDATLNHFLVLERQFNESNAPKVIEIIKQNQLLTSSHAVHDISDDVTINEESDMEGRREEKDVTGIPTGQEPMLKNLIRRPTAHAEKVLIEDHDVVVDLLYSGKPTKEVFEYLSEYFEWKAGKAKKSDSTS